LETEKAVVAAALLVGSEAAAAEEEEEEEELGLRDNGFAGAEAVVAEDTGWGACSTSVVGH
jgi:hypothetical protein